jgi:hypothetical protein
MRFVHHGQCHCGSIAIELRTIRAPEAQVLGACQCSFCRKHNARAFSDPGAHVTLRAVDPGNVQLYRFGLATADVVLCRACGVYMAMLLAEADGVRSVINVDALDDRARFTATSAPRDYSAETAQERIARRKAKWTPTTLLDWPAVPASGRMNIENDIETDGGRHG